MVITAQNQINPKRWKSNPLYNYYIENILKKDVDFFISLCKLRKGCFCIVKEDAGEKDIPKEIGTKKDSAVAGERIYVWSKIQAGNIAIGKAQTSGRGHNKMGAELKDLTFCAQDIGITLSKK